MTLELPMTPSVLERIPLNREQLAAVEHEGGPLLVIAGAGSGKTRVLTARVARLIERGIRPDRILAFTFTNRAAREMRERLQKVVGEGTSKLWVGTFHATGVRVLRREAGTLGLPAAFAIYDREDQESVLREILKQLERSEEGARLSEVLRAISDAKNALLSPAELAERAFSAADSRIAEAYARYQRALRANGALDFDDLISECVRLWRDHPEAAERWRSRFDHVLVDEYQDTNHAQFRLVHGLAAAHGRLFVVGDDDQSVYGFRGADLSNVLDFEQAFPGAATVKLEQNYRSTNNILNAADAVIENNRSRKGKRLWSEREAGPRLRFILTADDTEEARRVRFVLQEWQRKGRTLLECAVLYRTNAQSRALETELRRSFLPYTLVGGVSFFQRREVKDLVAYLRAAINPQDDVAFYRVWNTPRRGFGPSVKERVESRRAGHGETAEQALRTLAIQGAIKGVTGTNALELIAILERIRATADQPADAVMRDVLERTGYLVHLDREEDAAERRENVEELVASAADAATRGATLLEFLAETALFTDADRPEQNADHVTLLTMHNAKGLEFKAVVIAGLEEGLLPHGASLAEGRDLEEERRLFYVALTRAGDEVVMTAAAFRRRFDGARGSQVSRFVAEIPDELLDRDEPETPSWERARAAQNAHRGRRVSDDDGGGYGGGRGDWGDAPLTRATVFGTPNRKHRAVGRTVYHETFGRGVVLEAEGDGPDGRFSVRFGTVVKKVMGRFLSGGDDGDPA